jgi:hypothetical protein
MSLCRTIGLVVLLLTPKVAMAQALGTFGIQEENDLYAVNDRADRAYTNGTRLVWTWSPAPLSWIDRLFVPLCGGASHAVCGRSATGGIGQSMYTPENLRSRTRIKGDRSYGGWLYGMLMLDAMKEDRADHVELYAGVVGPASHAEQAQKFIHRHVATSAPDPLGWNTQISNRPGVLATYERRIKLVELINQDRHPYFDFTPALGGAAGTVFDYVSGSATLRAGYNLPPRFFRPIPSIASLGLLPESALNPEPSPWDAYVFATAEARYVAHNIFLDTQEEAYAIRRKAVVRDRRIGAAIRVHWLRIEYAQTFRSPEFEPHPRAHSYGTIKLTIGAQP